MHNVGQSFSLKSSGFGRFGRDGTDGSVIFGSWTLGSVIFGRLTLGRVMLEGRWGSGTPASARASLTPL